MTNPEADAAPSAQLEQLNVADGEDTSRPSSAQPQSLAKNAAKNEAKKAAKLAKFEAKQAKKQQSTAAATPTGEEGPKKAKAKKGSDAKTVPIPVTPEGEKKDMTGPMAAAYEPAAVEAGWYSWWEKQGYFEPALTADGQIKPKGKFVMAIPPPNVTGSLHLGHALTDSIQDCLTRWHRMQGYTTLWNPGCDHAGIATQAVVEKKLYRESKTTRHDLGREAFIKQVWVWKEKYGDRIYSQIKRLGASTDWKKVAFTLDPKLSKAVNEAFVRLHEEGIIYRANRLVNWSCKLSTALSNLEVNTLTLAGRTMMTVPGHEPTRKYEFGVIISFAYPIEGSEERIVVATTRLETMLADTAICVHPEDDRYRHLHHKYCVHPFNGRRIQIIPDEMVDREFGTGAVKITPAHDPNDFAVGKKHGLAFINLLDDNGRINENGGEFQGLMRFDARFKIQEALKAKGLYIETKDNPMALKVCSRSGDIIEPLIKPQWWVNCDDMSAAACDAVRSGALNIQPEASEKEWFKWLEHPQDWCISRQLWWGHQIPAYFVAIKGQPKKSDDDKTAWVSGRTEEEAMQKALSLHPGVKREDITLERDPDVLDTWFSSALWPFSIFGWPDKTKDFDLYYPNTMLETGWDILFFWVARMVMMGIKLTGQVPFKNVFCHAMVRDAHGRKMSKSLGNVIDPIDVIEGKSLDALMATLMEGNLDAKEVNKAKAGMKEDYPRGIPECGTDAMRFTLCSYTTGGRDINLNILRVDGYRKFCNKLWNATKFAMMKLGNDFKPHSGRVSTNVNLVDQWILYQLDKTLRDVQSSLTEYNFAQATMHVHQWWLYQLCDVYIEAIKPICDAGLAEGADEKAKSAALAAQQTLYTCLDEGLKMMHPFMPFVTEELWQRLPRRAGDATPSIMVAEWPEGLAEREHYKAEAQRFEKVVDVIKGTRSLATLCDLKQGALVVAKSADLASLLKAQLPLISTMTGKQSKVQIVAASEDTAGILGDGQAWQQSAILEDQVTLYIKGSLKPQ